MNALTLIDAIAPELASQPTSTKEVFVALAREGMSASKWGKVYEQAVAYKAAHLMTMSNVANNPLRKLNGGGAITSVKTGGESISFANAGAGASTAEEASWSETSYGRRYLQLRKTRAATMPRVV